MQYNFKPSHKFIKVMDNEMKGNSNKEILKKQNEATKEAEAEKEGKREENLQRDVKENENQSQQKQGKREQNQAENQNHMEDIEGLNQQEINKSIEEIQSEKLKILGIKSEEEVQAQVRRWKKLHKVIEKKRKVQQQLQQRKYEEEKQRAEKEAKMKAQSEQAMKRENIMKKLEEIQKRKHEREEKNNVETTKKKKRRREHLPIFMSKVKEFEMEEELRIKENILKKKREMMLDSEEIKMHEKKYLDQLKERYKKKESEEQGKRRRKSLEKAEDLAAGYQRNKSQFNLHLHGDSQRKQKELQKFLRRKRFEDKVRQMPVLIDHEKMKQALIARDKAKNPLKYNYLSNVAALTDEKIYEEFKDFEINIDVKELGNQYMKQAVNQVHSHQSRISKVRSESRLQGPKSERVEYKNYLPEIRSRLRKRLDPQLPENQIQEVLYQKKEKSEQINQLNRKSDLYEIEAIHRIQELRDVENYRDVLGKEEAIDDYYVKSLKMKIASAQIS